MYKSLLLVLALVCAAQAATITYAYTEGSSSKLWTDVTAWVGGVVPVAGDDVIIGGGGNTTRPQQTITLATALSLNSLWINSSDVVVTLQSIPLTVGTLTLGNGGARIAGTQATGSSLQVTTLVKTATISNLFQTWLSALSLTVSGTATWTGNLDSAANLAITNTGTWNWAIAATDSEDADTLNAANAVGFSLTNNGPMFLKKAIAQDGTTNQLRVNGDMTIASGSKVTIEVDCVLAVGREDTGNVAQYKLIVNGELAIQGTLSINDQVNTTFSSSSTFSESGAIVYFSYRTGSVLFIDRAFTWGNVQLQGYAHIYSNNQPLNIGNLQVNGGYLDGMGDVIATNLTVTKQWTNDIALGGGFTVSGRNITVTNTWRATNFPKFFLQNGANLIIAATGIVIFECNTILSSPDNTGNLVAVAGSTWNANVNGTCNVTIAVPAWFYGQTFYPTDATNGVTALNFTAGGQYHGNMTVPSTPDGTFGYRSNSNSWRAGLTAPFAIGSNAHFNGGVVPLTGGTFSFLGRSAGNTLGSAILVSAYNNVVLSADGANVVLDNFWAQAGTIRTTNGNNFSVSTGLRSDITNLNSSSVWQIDGTNFNILAGFTFDTPSFALLNNGAIHVASTGTLRATAGRLWDTAASTSGIYNRGIVSLVPSSTNAFAMDVNLWNAGQLVIEKGTTAAVLNINRAFQNQNSGTITVNAYSSSSVDRVALTVGSSTCVFGGTFRIAYQYTPAAGDSFTVLSTDTTTCTGIFAVRADNVPANHQVVLVYDQAPASGSGSNVNAVVCASSDTACINRGNRDPVKSSTTMMPTTGSDTTQAGSTTRGNTGGSSASFLVAAPLLVLFSIFASLL